MTRLRSPSFALSWQGHATALVRRGRLPGLHRVAAGRGRPEAARWPALTSCSGLLAGLAQKAQRHRQPGFVSLGSGGGGGISTPVPPCLPVRRAGLLPLADGPGTARSGNNGAAGGRSRNSSESDGSIRRAETPGIEQGAAASAGQGSASGSGSPRLGRWRSGRRSLYRARRDLDVALRHRQLGHVGRAVDRLATDAWDQLDQPIDHGGEGGWAL
jgi:hypothetical protein